MTRDITTVWKELATIWKPKDSIAPSTTYKPNEDNGTGSAWSPSAPETNETEPPL